MKPVTDETFLIAQRLLRMFDAASGVSVRERQIIDDYQIKHNLNASKDAILAALEWMIGKELVERHTHELRGRLYTITARGKREAEQLAYESL